MVTDDPDPAPDWKPATPSRRTGRIQALSGLFRTPTRLTTPTMAISRRNKRSRARASSLSSPSTPSTSPSANIPTLPAVVLQTYSLSTDSIVLTTLPSVPFCCHEDLLTMPRTRLEGVVRALNERLPRRMRIGPENGEQADSDGCDEDDDGLSRMSEAEMKKRIEELVGIRAIVGKNRVSRSGLGLGARIGGVPPAPKAVRTRDPMWRPYEKNPWDMEADDDGFQTDDLSITIEDALMGSSPLASRAKFGLHSRGRINPLSRLASLQEESEGSESKEDNEDSESRPSKRQRVSSASATQDSKGGPQVMHEARDSRLVEDMDISGSPLMTEDTFDDMARSDMRIIPTTTNPKGTAKMAEKYVQSAFQRRRSARIKEIALKRASSVDGVKKIALGAQLGLKSSAVCSKTFSARRSSWSNSTSLGRSDTRKDLSTPRELVIRLPFTSTPPQKKPDSSSWSAPRILRSHSQRLMNPNKSLKDNTPLGRSLSERYPRPSDLTFVTINRPRYRFAGHKSRGSKVAKEDDQESKLQKLVNPMQIIGTSIRANEMSSKHEHKQENDPRNTGLHALPSALCSFLTPRARAPSTSTVASTPCNGSDSPARTVSKERDTQATTTERVIRNGTTVCVSEALERMTVDSLQDLESEG